jgi:hypothetical protein
MSIRYITNVALMVAAGFLVVATQAFGAPTAAALTFAVVIGLTIVSLYTAVGVKSIAQRVIGGVGVVLGAWTIVASLVFVPATAASLGFAAAIAFVGLGLAGLTVHELSTERVVHALEVVDELPKERQRGRNGKAVAA